MPRTLISLIHLEYDNFSNNAFKSDEFSTTHNDNIESRTFYEPNENSSQVNTIKNFDSTVISATPKYEDTKDTTQSYHLVNEKEKTNNQLELTKPNKPSVSFSSTWHLPVAVGDQRNRTQEDQYISNLIRDSRNYKFGKISL